MAKAKRKILNITSARQFDTKFINNIFSAASKIEDNKFNKNILKNYVMSALFYEPSTRTRLSFESAMLKLGGSVISTENAAQFSSASKGETLEDTIRIVESYSDVIVLRHNKPGASDSAAQLSSVPIINAGDGNGEHPTQALLDLYTIYKKFPKALSARKSKNAETTIAMIGDLANGRTIHSLSYLLSLYQNVQIIYVSPGPIGIPKNLKKYLVEKKIPFTETENLEKGVKNADVIYQTRIQKERFKNKAQYKKYFGKYILNKKTLKQIKKNAIIMHPLPRVNEISPEVDSDPRAVYFSQAKSGLYIRMALLMFVFDKA